MSIKVKFFASLREHMGVAERDIDFIAGQTVTDVWTGVSDIPMTNNVFCAVNQQYADVNTRVKDGDEVAFFPPVTGG